MIIILLYMIKILEKILLTLVIVLIIYTLYNKYSSDNGTNKSDDVYLFHTLNNDDKFKNSVIILINGKFFSACLNRIILNINSNNSSKIFLLDNSINKDLQDKVFINIKNIENIDIDQFNKIKIVIDKSFEEASKTLIYINDNNIGIAIKTSLLKLNQIDTFFKLLR